MKSRLRPHLWLTALLRCQLVPLAWRLQGPPGCGCALLQRHSLLPWKQPWPLQLRLLPPLQLVGLQAVAAPLPWRQAAGCPETLRHLMWPAPPQHWLLVGARRQLLVRLHLLKPGHASCWPWQQEPAAAPQPER